MRRRLTETALKNGYTVMVTSDHGNAEEMWDYKINMPKTAHTTNPVEFIYAAGNTAGLRLRPHGILSDVAPTVLEVLGLKQPADMTSKSLLQPVMPETGPDVEDRLRYKGYGTAL